MSITNHRAGLRRREIQDSVLQGVELATSQCMQVVSKDYQVGAGPPPGPLAWRPPAGGWFGGVHNQDQGLVLQGGESATSQCTGVSHLACSRGDHLPEGSGERLVSCRWAVLGYIKT